jgi:hypothetical protein
MAEFKISGRMSVAGLKNQFKTVYGLELRVYKGPKFADEKATLASLSEKKIDDFECRANMKVGSFETNFESATGLKVQVATLPDAKVEPGKLVNNEFTLGEAKRKFGV